MVEIIQHVINDDYICSRWCLINGLNEISIFDIFGHMFEF